MTVVRRKVKFMDVKPRVPNGMNMSYNQDCCVTVAPFRSPEKNLRPAILVGFSLIDHPAIGVPLFWCEQQSTRDLDPISIWIIWILGRTIWG